MKIDKLINSNISLDDWNIKRFNVKSASIDELAYYLYISENKRPTVNLYGFISSKDIHYRYYDKANIIMRKEKLEKLNNI